jgi:hypothetical protein
VTWREDKDLPPSRERICSPYDTDAHTRPSAAPAGKATRSTSARPATMQPPRVCPTSSRTLPRPMRLSPTWRCWNTSTPALTTATCYLTSTS